MAVQRQSAQIARLAAGAASGKRRRRRRAGRRTLHYSFIFLFFLATGIALSLTVFFGIESVTVTGTDKYPPEEIVDASGIRNGENMFRVDAKRARETILEKFPYIESVEFRYKLPHAIQLALTQCKPSAALSFGDGEYMLITREGKVLERGLVYVPEDVPVVKGVDAGGAQPGELLEISGEETGKIRADIQRLISKLSQAQDPERYSLIEIANMEAERSELEQALAQREALTEAMVMLNYLLKAIEDTGFSQVTNVDLSDSYNMKIVYENRLLFKLGTEANLSDKLNFIRQIIETELPSNAQGVVDVGDISKNWLIYSEMPIEEALSGDNPSKRSFPAATDGAAENDAVQLSETEKQSEPE